MKYFITLHFIFIALVKLTGQSFEDYLRCGVTISFKDDNLDNARLSHIASSQTHYYKGDKFKIEYDSGTLKRLLFDGEKEKVFRMAAEVSKQPFDDKFFVIHI